MGWCCGLLSCSQLSGSCTAGVSFRGFCFTPIPQAKETPYSGLRGWRWWVVSLVAGEQEPGAILIVTALCFLWGP